ncbi:hypothetical protein [Aquabacterium sp.]|uniref:hypothetical protein n=1 Tax=Aquabacterium sp. TaxID=1872578 RepID=UPI001983C6C6|nr:hypothetical protein [Aquabacterium sp.]MBC7700115.1 hypothetical protein [Aquabacterium sp.]
MTTGLKIVATLVAKPGLEDQLEQHMASPAMKALQQPHLKDLLQGGIQQDFLSLLLDL